MEFLKFNYWQSKDLTTREIGSLAHKARTRGLNLALAAKKQSIGIHFPAQNSYGVKDFQGF